MTFRCVKIRLSNIPLISFACLYIKKMFTHLKVFSKPKNIPNKQIKAVRDEKRKRNNS